MKNAQVRSRIVELVRNVKKEHGIWLKRLSTSETVYHEQISDSGITLETINAIAYDLGVDPRTTYVELEGDYDDEYCPYAHLSLIKREKISDEEWLNDLEIMCDVDDDEDDEYNLYLRLKAKYESVETK